MVDKRRQLTQLIRLAELKSELELKRFAAFGTSVEAVRSRIGQAEEGIAQCYAAAAPLSLGDARVASAQAGDFSRQAERARRDLQVMLPRYELARQRAIREFGRAKALHSLAEREGGR